MTFKKKASTLGFVPQQLFSIPIEAILQQLLTIRVEAMFHPTLKLLLLLTLPAETAAH